MLKYIVGFLVVLAAWATYVLLLPDSEELWWGPVLVTLLVVGVLAALVVMRRLRARRAARELEKALAAQAAEQARMARPDMQGEVLQMQQEFQRAIAALKSSRVSRGGEDALYALPWHVIIGPPGSGKSTALRNSGLQFPYMSSSGGGVRGVGGTRNCDWWLTNEAVLLDTAGRWATEDEDRNEWMSFLDLIRRFRPRKPLDGIIAAVSLEQIGGAHDEEVSALARRMRERIDEVQSRLQMSLPVYVLFTKADLLPGFVETFGDLSKQDRGQVWGFTVPLAKPPADAGMHFAERFDEMASIVERRSLRRLGEERKIETRELIHGFPQQLATVRKGAMGFVSKLFDGGAFGETPMFRGVYFSSGTQEGRPIDRVMHKMAEAFGIRSEVNLGEPVTEAKSYFLRDVFLNVVFPDRDVAVRSAAEQGRQRRNQFIAAGVIFATALLISIVPAWAWANNRGLLTDVREEVDRVDATARTEGQLSAADLEPLRARVEQLDEWDRNGASFRYRLGMYQDDVAPPVRQLYTRLLRSQVVLPIVAEDEQRLEEFGQDFARRRDAIPTRTEHTEIYERLRAYLLVTGPAEEEQPNLSLRSNSELAGQLADRIARRWRDHLGGEDQISDEEFEQMRSHAQLYVRLLAEGDRTRPVEDAAVAAGEDVRFRRNTEDIVDPARAALTRVPVSDMEFSMLIQDAEGRGFDLRLEDIVGNTVATPDGPMRARGMVTGAFTRRAWDCNGAENCPHSIRAKLYGSTTAASSYEAWVLGPQLQASQEQTRSQEEVRRTLRNQYFRQYVQVWRDFLNGIEVLPPQTNEGSLRELRLLTQGNPEPYRLLFRSVLDNTVLPLPPEEQQGETGGAVSDTILERLMRRVRTFRGSQMAEAVMQDILGQPGAAASPEQVRNLGPEHVFVAFEDFARFGAAPAPVVQEGQPPPPSPSLPLDTYEEQIRMVRDALQTHLETPRGTVEALDTALQTARGTTRSLIERQPVGWRPTIEKLLWPPIEGSTNSVAVGQAGAADSRWCSDVYTPYVRNIQGNYPMNPGGHDVPLQDFAAYYQPESGTLWAFYTDALQRRVPREEGSYMFATNLGQRASMAYRSQLLQYLERAHDITSTFFPPNAEGPTVQFDVRIRPSVRVATQEFCAGGQCIEYHNGPEQWTRYTWPGEDPVAGASIEIRGEGGIHERLEQEGEWGLFRLLEQGTISQTSRGRRVFTMTWRLRDHQVDVSMDIRPVRADTPFFGVMGRERTPPLLQPLRARDVDPPSQIATSNRRPCQVPRPQ